MEFDIIIKNGRIIDGTGAPGTVQDIGITEDTIADTGKLDGCRAHEIVDASGLIVCPGFIDIHAHSDFNLLVNPPGRSKIQQGVTTEVCGNCGVSGAPLLGKAKEQRQKSLSALGVDITWSSFSEYIEFLNSKQLFSNLAFLVGHGNLRGSIIGYENRAASSDELKKMVRLLDNAMAAGAWGLSSGLFYPPGQYASADELQTLVKVALRYGGIYATHIRNEEDTVAEAIAEAIQTGQNSGVSVQISHLKTMGRRNWEKLPFIFQQIENAREQGLNISADRYPYTAASTDLDALLPGWAYEGGIDEEISRLRSRNNRERIFTHITDGRSAEEIFNAILIARVHTEHNKSLEGKTVVEAAAIRNQSIQDTFFDLLIEETLRVGAIFFSMSEENLEHIYQKEYVMIGSDSSIWDLDGPLGAGKPHPRGFGTFPRVVKKYVFEKKVLTLEQAIKKMTSQPAEKIGLIDRGILKKGYKADILVLKAEDLADRATYEDPHQFPDGVRLVMVNGKKVVKEGLVTGLCSGMILLKRN